MGVVDEFEVLHFKLINLSDLRIQLQLRKRVRHPRQLHLEGLHVIAVHVRVAEGVHEFAALEAANLGQHAGQERVGRDVEGDAEAHVAGSLIHLAAQSGLLVASNIELCKDVARRQRHIFESRRVPGRHDDSSALRLVLNRLNNLRELVHALIRVVIVHGLVGGAKVPPLESVNGPQVPLLTVLQSDFVEEFSGSISVPNLDFLVAQLLGVGLAVDEPEQLLSDSSPKDVLGGQNWKAFAQVESHLVAEFCVDASVGAVVLKLPSLNNVIDHFQILHLGMLRIFLHEFCRHKLRILRKERRIAKDTEIKGDILVRIGP